MDISLAKLLQEEWDLDPSTTVKIIGPFALGDEVTLSNPEAQTETVTYLKKEEEVDESGAPGDDDEDEEAGPSKRPRTRASTRDLKRPPEASRVRRRTKKDADAGRTIVRAVAQSMQGQMPQYARLAFFRTLSATQRLLLPRSVWPNDYSKLTWREFLALPHEIFSILPYNALRDRYQRETDLTDQEHQQSERRLAIAHGQANIFDLLPVEVNETILQHGGAWAMLHYVFSQRRIWDNLTRNEPKNDLFWLNIANMINFKQHSIGPGLADELGRVGPCLKRIDYSKQDAPEETDYLETTEEGHRPVPTKFKPQIEFTEYYSLQECLFGAYLQLLPDELRDIAERSHWYMHVIIFLCGCYCQRCGSPTTAPEVPLILATEFWEDKCYCAHHGSSEAWSPNAATGEKQRQPILPAAQVTRLLTVDTLRGQAVQQSRVLCQSCVGQGTGIDDEGSTISDWAFAFTPAAESRPHQDALRLRTPLPLPQPSKRRQAQALKETLATFPEQIALQQQMVNEGLFEFETNAQTLHALQLALEALEHQQPPQPDHIATMRVLITLSETRLQERKTSQDILSLQLERLQTDYHLHSEDLPKETYAPIHLFFERGEMEKLLWQQLPPDRTWLAQQAVIQAGQEIEEFVDAEEIL